VSKSGLSRRSAAARILMSIAAGALCLASPAHAQFLSDSYKFLDAVKKKDGQKVEDMVSEPGSTIINTHDVTTGETALIIVTQRRDLTWLVYLLQKGADANAHDSRGVTPLQLAVNLGWFDGVLQLVAHGADVDYANDAGETPLINAVHRKDIDMIRLLLKAGADPDKADSSGRTARDYAKLGGSDSQLLAEIDKNAKPKEQRARSGAVYGPTL
jgi:ankyrin repeat protein